MKRIAVDMDGVLADAYPQFIKEHEAEFGERKSIQEAIGKAEFEIFPNGYKYCSSAGFFQKLAGDHGQSSGGTKAKCKI